MKLIKSQAFMREVNKITSIYKLIYLIMMFSIFFISPNDGFSWNYETHRNIVTATAKSDGLPKELKTFLNKYTWQLGEGAYLPDEEDTEEVRRHDDENIIERINQICKMLIKSQTDKEFVKNLGRLSHYISDANNPLHCDQTDEEYEVHSRYETEAEIVPITVPKGKPVYIDSVETLIAKATERGIKSYKEIIDAYYNKEGNQIKAVYNTTQKALNNSASDTMDIWYTIWRDRIFYQLKSNLKSANDYIKLADEYMRDSFNEEAKEILKKGIKKIPNDHMIKQKLTLLQRAKVSP